MSRMVGLATLVLVLYLATPVPAQQTFTYGNDYSKLNYLPSSSSSSLYRPPGPRLPSFSMTSLLPTVTMPSFLPRWGSLGIFTAPKTTFVPGAQPPKTTK